LLMLNKYKKQVAKILYLFSEIRKLVSNPNYKFIHSTLDRLKTNILNNIAIQRGYFTKK
jgi:CHASE3 domain sensor protein